MQKTYSIYANLQKQNLKLTEKKKNVTSRHPIIDDLRTQLQLFKMLFLDYDYIEDIIESIVSFGDSTSTAFKILWHVTEYEAFYVLKIVEPSSTPEGIRG